MNSFTRWIITQPGVGSLKLTGPEGNCFPDMGKELELVVDIFLREQSCRRAALRPSRDR
jgi:hypothetical protein